MCGACRRMEILDAKWMNWHPNRFDFLFENMFNFFPRVRVREIQRCKSAVMTFVWCIAVFAGGTCWRYFEAC